MLLYQLRFVLLSLCESVFVCVIIVKCGTGETFLTETATEAFCQVFTYYVIFVQYTVTKLYRCVVEFKDGYCVHM